MKKASMHIIAFAATLAVLWGLMIISSCIPNSAIKEGMTDSALIYGNTDAFSFGENGRYNSVADNYADSILLNVLWNIKSNIPFTSSLDTKYYDGEDMGENWGLYQTINGTSPNTDYTRYWHGSVTFIRPLLLFTDANGVKNIGFIALIIFISITLTLLISKKHYFAAVSLVISLIGIQFWNIRLSLEYIPAFMVCFLLCPLYIYFEEKGYSYLTVLSVISGVMVAFYDFLTVETISVSVPLVLVFMIRCDDNRLEALKNNIILTIKCGISWGTAYVMTFLVKWTAVSVCTGENKFTNAFSAAGIRLYAEQDMPLYRQIPSAVAANISTLFGGTERVDIINIIIGLIGTAFVIGVVLVIFRKKRTDTSLMLTLLIILSVPYLRYIFLNNHSYLHEFFTYRAQITVILCLCAMVGSNTEFRLFKK